MGEKTLSRFWKSLFESISCIPPYWKFFVPENATINECKNSSQLKEVYSHWIEGETRSARSNVMSTFKQPCNEMSFSVNTDTEQRKIGWNGITNDTMRFKIIWIRNTSILFYNLITILNSRK